MTTYIASNTNPLLYNLAHTTHSELLCAKRNITDDDLQMALNYTESIFKQGLIFHIVKDKFIPTDLCDATKSRIRNMVIVMSGDDDAIITVYKSSKAMYNIKRKCKQNALSRVDRSRYLG